MKRLLMLSPAVPWPDKPLLGIFHAFQADALRAQGVEMRVFSPSLRIPRVLGRILPRVRRRLQRPERYAMHGLQVAAPRVPFAFPSRVRFQLAPHMPDVIDRWARLAVRPALDRAVASWRPDAVVAHGTLPFAGLAASLADDLGIPKAVIEHSSDDVLRLRRGSRLAKFYAKTLAHMDGVLAVGPKMVEHLQRVVGVSHSQLLVNGTLPTDRSTLKVPRPSKMADKFIVLAAANYYPRKGLEVLANAFEAAVVRGGLQNAELHLVSRLPDSLRRSLTSSERVGRVVIHEPMSASKLRQWMAWSDLFALTSWGEAFGLVYAEALSSGTPILLTHDCGFADMLKTRGIANGEVGWAVEPQAVNQTAEALAAAAAAGSRRRSMGLAGRALVERDFTWRQNARTVMDALAL